MLGRSSAAKNISLVDPGGGGSNILNYLLQELGFYSTWSKESTTLYLPQISFMIISLARSDHQFPLIHNLFSPASSFSTTELKIWSIVKGLSLQICLTALATDNAKGNMGKGGLVGTDGDENRDKHQAEGGL